ncbi:hypothetical protein PAXINDRAFT_177297 [Paxillus involutus ATCC 200175]|uniref:C2H2-type domain-containing protein n=1 Tax=Paxillus involutus ATCC 200175 TaxID=664439 RepID=A0A0C9T7Z1_PAXIN|nr:hypothetical protein PAXINDRAFT_177297 [Paxillus involutus ATCC 200175]
MYNHYPQDPRQDPRQMHPTTQPSRQPHDFPTSYADPSHHHTAMAYATVNPQMPSGNMGNHPSNPQQYPYSPYPAQSPQVVADERRSYFAPTSHGSALDHYATPHSPPNTYASAPSGHMSSPRHIPQHGQHFIPTPSQTYQYSSTSPASSPRSRSSVEPYYHMSPNPQHAVHSPAPSHGRSIHGSHVANSSTATADRHPCDLCERSFTRLHDRRRHFETVHAPSPVLHKCRYCRKDFSRADSLKRHLDNGCDEMPTDQ